MNEQQNCFIEIRMRRCRLFLTEAEIISLLAHNESLWTEALKRGKAFTRTRQASERQVKVPQKG